MILFSLAMSFMDTSTVLPEFVGQATNSALLVGLSGVMFTLFWRVPQLALAPAVNRAPRKLPWMFWGSVPGRLIFFVVAAVVAGVGMRSPGLMLLVFFGGYGLFALGDGVATLAWVELIGNAVSDRTRGILFGASQVITGIAILGIQGLLRELLGPLGPGYPVNFAVVFAIAGILFALTLPFVANLYERPTKTPPRAIELSEYLPYLRKILREDKPFRFFLVMRFFLESAYYVVVPFYIGYEIKVLGVPAAQAVSDSLIAVTLGSIGGSIVTGWLGSRYSSRSVIWVQAVAVLIGPALALASPSLGREVLLVSFVTIGLAGASATPGLLGWMIAYPPPGDRPIYNGIANTLGIGALIMPVVGGLVLQAVSYTALFSLAMVMALISVVTASRLVAPRKQEPQQA